MEEWTPDCWKTALEAQGTDKQKEAYQKLADYLYNYAIGNLLTSYSSEQERNDKARDLVQETLLTIYHKYSTFRWKSHIKTWATKILINEYNESVRKKTETPIGVPSDKESGESTDPFEISNVTEVGQNPDVSIEDQVEAKEFKQQLEGCLAEIPKIHRIIFVECQIRERKPAEVAKELGIPCNLVYVSLYRAKRKLQECLRRLGYGPRA